MICIVFSEHYFTSPIICPIGYVIVVGGCNHISLVYNWLCQTWFIKRKGSVKILRRKWCDKRNQKQMKNLQKWRLEKEGYGILRSWRNYRKSARNKKVMFKKWERDQQNAEMIRQQLQTKENNTKTKQMLRHANTQTQKLED